MIKSKRNEKHTDAVNVIAKRIIKTETRWQLAVFFISLVFYLATIAPTVLWGDDAGFQRCYYLFQISLAPTSHPLWIILAQPFRYLPFGDIAFRANLASAFFGALTLWLVYIITGFYSKSIRDRLIATAILGVSHTFWQHCVRAEVYTLNAIFFVAVWYLLLIWRRGGKLKWLILASILWIASLGNHILMTIAVPGYLLLAIGPFFEHEYRKYLFLSIIALIILFCLVVFFQPQVRQMFVLAWKDTWPPYTDFATLAIAVLLLGYNLVLSVPVAIAGLVEMHRNIRVEMWAIMLFVVSYIFITIISDHKEDYVFYIPAYVAMAVACAPGIGWLKKRWAGFNYRIILLALVALPIIVYAVTPVVLEKMDIKLLFARDLPGRNARNYFMWPPKTGYRGAREFGESTLKNMPPNALIMADGTIGKTLLYLQQVEGFRPDVRVVLSEPPGKDKESFVVEKTHPVTGVENWRIIGAHAPFLYKQSFKRPVFLADVQLYYDMSEIEKRFKIQPFGYVYELRRR